MNRNNNNQRIGIFGGSFNPIHNGHIQIAQNILSKLKLDKLILVPSFISPHKKNIKMADAHHRKNMVDLAIQDLNNIESSSYEIDKKGISYTIDTINYYNSIFPNSKLFLLLGSDSLDYLYGWKSINFLFKKCEIVLFQRLGYQSMKDEILKSRFSDEYKDILIYNIIDITVEKISSSFVRSLIGKGDKLNDFINKDVFKYIVDNNVYHR